MQDVNASESAEYIDAVAIVDLEGLLSHETEDYTCENADTNTCQVAEFVTESLSPVQTTILIMLPTALQHLLQPLLVLNFCILVNDAVTYFRKMWQFLMQCRLVG